MLHGSKRVLLFDDADYLNKVMAIDPAYLIQGLPLDEAGGLIAYDRSGRMNNGTYAASGFTYGVPGIGDGRTAIRPDGNNTYIMIGTADFAADWNGDKFSMISWGQVDAASRWTDVSTYRYLTHVRSSADATYYAVMGHSQTNHQLEWRRRSGGVIVSQTYTFNPAGPTDWFCMGMTFDIAIPLLDFYLYDSLNGWRKLTGSSSANLTAWGSNPPDGNVALLGAGSVTLQEWIGDFAHSYIWGGVKLSDSQILKAMTR